MLLGLELGHPHQNGFYFNCCVPALFYILPHIYAEKMKLFTRRLEAVVLPLSRKKGVALVYFSRTFLEAILMSSALTVFRPACIA